MDQTRRPGKASWKCTLAFPCPAQHCLTYPLPRCPRMNLEIYECGTMWEGGEAEAKQAQPARWTLCLLHSPWLALGILVRPSL